MVYQNTLLEFLLVYGVSDYAIRTSTTEYTAVTFSQITQICSKLEKFCSKMRTECLRYKDFGRYYYGSLWF